jgi:predicted RNA binding protein YcfA (HicA-like mRNA interferase family)
MGERQPGVAANEIIKVLKSLGFEKIDQAGSHQKWKYPLTGKLTIIPTTQEKLSGQRRLKRFLKVQV